MNVSYEIDFLPVGNGERSGDAICVRYGTPGNYKVMVYDGGTKESGEKLVEHIKTFYGTSHVDYVVCSHPDADHASGLSVVLEQLSVGELWMHRPWEHSKLILDYFHDGRITDTSLADRLKDKMAAAHALEELAQENDVPIFEPFQGAQIGDFYVLSPDRDWYVHELIADFEKSPDKKKAAEAQNNSLLTLLLIAAKDAALKAAESWGIETLREDVCTSAENESSVVLFGVIADRGILLTGDAGVQSLSNAARYAEGRNVSIPQTYYALSGKASDVSRQLSFAGIALVWIFKAEKGGPLAVPDALLLPAALFVFALALDLVQYVYGSLAWGFFARYYEGRQTPESTELSAPMYINWPSLFCFWLKLATGLAAYAFVLTYITSLLPKT